MKVQIRESATATCWSLQFWRRSIRLVLKNKDAERKSFKMTQNVFLEQTFNVNIMEQSQIPHAIWNIIIEQRRKRHSVPITTNWLQTESVCRHKLTDRENQVACQGFQEWRPEIWLVIEETFKGRNRCNTILMIFLVSRNKHISQIYYHIKVQPPFYFQCVLVLSSYIVQDMFSDANCS